MKRSLKVTLKFANANKIKQLDNLWIEYKQAIKDFLDRLFSNQDLSEDCLKSYNNLLSYRYKQCAKRQALKLFKTWCRNKKKKNKPTLSIPHLTLDYRFIEVQKSNNSFDYWAKISTLDKGKPILLPLKSYNYLNQYFTDWQLIKGGKLIKQNNQWLLILAFEKDTPGLRQSGKTIGLDIGYRKLGVTSDNQIIGQNIRTLINKADRKVFRSNGYQRVKSEIKNYINKELKLLFSAFLKCLVVENLKNLKQNKKGVWSKSVNRKFNFWLYGYCLTRISQLCEYYGVHNPSIVCKNTSRECSICGYISKSNRVGEYFRCLRCNHQDDADHNASINIANRFMHQLIVGAVSNPFL